MSETRTTVKRISAILNTGKPLREPPLPGVRAQDLREQADRPGFLARAVFNPLKNAFNKVTHRKPVNDNALERDTKAKVNWPNVPKQ